MKAWEPCILKMPVRIAGTAEILNFSSGRAITSFTSRRHNENHFEKLAFAYGWTDTDCCMRQGGLPGKGYIAVGGEWLVIPLLVTVKAVVKSVAEDILNEY